MHLLSNRWQNAAAALTTAVAGVMGTAVLADKDTPNKMNEAQSWVAAVTITSLTALGAGRTSHILVDGYRRIADARRNKENLPDGPSR